LNGDRKIRTEKTTTNTVKKFSLCPAGLVEVNSRIPLTKSLHLEEAENLIRRPER
jgi:hypothetical protein